VTDVPTWVLLLLRIASGNQYTQDTPKGENHIAGKAQIGVKVALTSPLSSMSQYFHPVIEHNNLPYWRPPPWLKYQAFKFLLENPTEVCAPVTNSAPIQPIEPPELSGKKREAEEDSESESEWIASDWIHPYKIKLKKIKLEDPKGNFW
jgi:hypothetical protein